jgi:hypothetical protein
MNHPVFTFFLLPPYFHFSEVSIPFLLSADSPLHNFIHSVGCFNDAPFAVRSEVLLAVTVKNTVFRADLKMETAVSSETMISTKLRVVTCQKTVISVFTDMITSILKIISHVQYYCIHFSPAPLAQAVKCIRDVFDFESWHTDCPE